MNYITESLSHLFDYKINLNSIWIIRHTSVHKSAGMHLVRKKNSSLLVGDIRVRQDIFEIV